jgi:RNA polymerase sigma-70 factor, ECF subfamily
MAGKGESEQQLRSRFEQEALPHLDALYTMAVRLARNPHDANDLLQETVLRAYRFFHQFTPGTNCRAWLLTILFNNFRNAWRRTSREQPASSAEELDRRIGLESFAADQAGSDPEALAGGAEGMDREVAAALDALPGEFREALLLVDVEELNYQEVAEVLAIPVGTVKSRVSRGRALLRAALAKYARERGIIRS